MEILLPTEATKLADVKDVDKAAAFRLVSNMSCLTLLRYMCVSVLHNAAPHQSYPATSGKAGLSTEHSTVLWRASDLSLFR